MDNTEASEGQVDVLAKQDVANEGMDARFDWQGIELLIDAIQALAWPLVTLLIFWRLRTPITNVVGKMTSLKAPGGFEASFDQQLDKATEAANEDMADEQELVQVATTLADNSSQDLLNLAESHPHAAVVASYTRLETTARRIAANTMNSEFGKQQRFGNNLFGKLRKYGIIDSDMYSRYRDLQQLRNIAVHDATVEITKGQAVQYVELAESLRNSIARHANGIID